MPMPMPSTTTTMVRCASCAQRPMILCSTTGWHPFASDGSDGDRCCSPDCCRCCYSLSCGRSRLSRLHYGCVALWSQPSVSVSPASSHCCCCCCCCSDWSPRPDRAVASARHRRQPLTWPLAPHYCPAHAADANDAPHVGDDDVGGATADAGTDATRVARRPGGAATSTARRSSAASVTSACGAAAAGDGGRDGAGAVGGAAERRAALATATAAPQAVAAMRGASGRVGRTTAGGRRFADAADAPAAVLPDWRRAAAAAVDRRHALRWRTPLWRASREW